MVARILRLRRVRTCCNDDRISIRKMEQISMNMREKMAIEMAKKAGARDWDAMSEMFRASWLGLADAALVALEEPTEAMRKEGERVLWIGGIPNEIFRAMIGAAKGEGC